MGTDRATRGHAATEDRVPTNESKPLVLVALEPRTYASVIGRVVADLRPGLSVQMVEADDVVAEAERLSAALVLCSAPCPDPHLPGTRWIEFRPYDEPETLRVDGRDVPIRADGSGMDLEDVLWIVDWVPFAGVARRGEERRHGS